MDEVNCKVQHETITEDNFFDVIVRSNNSLANAIQACFFNESLLLKQIKNLRLVVYSMFWLLAMMFIVMLSKGLL